MYFSGIGMILLSASKAELLVERDGGIWSFLTWWTTNHLSASPASRKWVMRWWKRPFWFSKKINVTLSSNWTFPDQDGCSQVLISSRKFDSSICDRKKYFLLFLWEISPLLHWVFLRRFQMRPSCPTRQYLQPVCHPSKLTPNAYKAYPRNNPGGETFFPNWWILDWSVRSYRVILNQCTKWNNRSFKWLPKESLGWGLPWRASDKRYWYRDGNCNCLL